MPSLSKKKCPRSVHPGRSTSYCSSSSHLNLKVRRKSAPELGLLLHNRTRRKSRLSLGRSLKLVRFTSSGDVEPWKRSIGSLRAPSTVCTDTSFRTLSADATVDSIFGAPIASTADTASTAGGASEDCRDDASHVIAMSELFDTNGPAHSVGDVFGPGTDGEKLLRRMLKQRQRWDREDEERRRRMVTQDEVSEASFLSCDTDTMEQSNSSRYKMASIGDVEARKESNETTDWNNNFCEEKILNHFKSMTEEARLHYQQGRDAYQSGELMMAFRHQNRALMALKAMPLNHRVRALNALHAEFDDSAMSHEAKTAEEARNHLETKVRLELAKIRMLQSSDRTVTPRKARQHRVGAKCYLSCILRHITTLGREEQCLADLPFGLVDVLSSAGTTHCNKSDMGLGVLYHRAALHLGQSAVLNVSSSNDFKSSSREEVCSQEHSSTSLLGRLHYALGLSTLLHVESLQTGIMTDSQRRQLQHEGIEHLNEALDFRRDAHEISISNPERCPKRDDKTKQDLIQTLDALGSAQFYQNFLAASMDTHLELVKLLQQNTDDSTPNQGLMLAGALYGLARVLITMGNDNESLKALGEAIRVLDLYPEDEEDASALREETHCEEHEIRSMNLFIAKSAVEANGRKSNGECVEGGGSSTRSRGSLSKYENLHLSCLKMAAQVYCATFDLPSAANTQLRILRHQYGTIGRLHPTTAKTWNTCGRILVQAKRFRQAALCFEEEIEIRKFLACESGGEAEGLLRALCNLARLYGEKSGEAKTAKEFYDKAIQVSQRARKKESVNPLQWNHGHNF